MRDVSPHQMNHRSANAGVAVGIEGKAAADRLHASARYSAQRLKFQITHLQLTAFRQTFLQSAGRRVQPTGVQHGTASHFSTTISFVGNAGFQIAEQAFRRSEEQRPITRSTSTSSGTSTFTGKGASSARSGA